MKREEKTRLTRERIISAGIKEFGTKGYSGASINSVSDSGIAKGLLYHNFKSKDELYVECLRVCFGEITESLSCCGENDGLREYFRKRSEFFNEKRDMGSMVLEALVAPPEKHIDEIARLRMPYDEMNAEWIRRLIESGKLRDNIDKNSALKYLSAMQDMFNWYCCNPKYSGSSLAGLVNLHEEKLPVIFDYLLYGIMRGNDL
ncbi:MAG: TetR/AcrR family transcriptional regulator [Oscillospiraceae bacterium]